MMPHHCNDEFNAAERRALRRMLAWFRSAADSSSDDEGAGGPVGQSPIPPSNCSEGASTVWEVVGEPCYAAGASASATTTTTATGGDLILMMGQGKCIHKVTCHHAKRQMSKPNCLRLCDCVDKIVRDKKYYMDWDDMIHNNTECKQFVGRQSRCSEGTTMINISKKVLSPCSQCF